MSKARIGVIGGSGLYAMDELTAIEEVRVSTPFGDPSDAITIGTLAGERVAFLPRHARGHRILPGDIPVRANIYALKSLGVEWVIAASAVGSLREEIAPLHMVIPDQIIDRTKGRVSTFFTTGLVGHVGFADPFCPVLAGWQGPGEPRVGEIAFRRGDRFLEHYYPGRGYAIWQVETPAGRVKGWYCNISTPVSEQDDILAFDDLLLDVLVYPDGRYAILDRAEFAAARRAGLPDIQAASAEAALTEVLALVHDVRPPFAFSGTPRRVTADDEDEANDAPRVQADGGDDLRHADGAV